MDARFCSSLILKVVIACAHCAAIVDLLAAEEISITSGPSDATVNEGESLYMCCEYEGTLDIPSWRINGTVYLATDLPLNHTYTEKGLYIHKAKRSLSNTMYSCLFFARHGGRIATVESLPGVLVVKSTKSYVVRETIMFCTLQNVTVNESTVATTEQTEQIIKWLPVVLVCVLVGGSIAVVLLYMFIRRLLLKSTSQKSTLLL